MSGDSSDEEFVPKAKPGGFAQLMNLSDDGDSDDKSQSEDDKPVIQQPTQDKNKKKKKPLKKDAKKKGAPTTKTTADEDLEALLANLDKTMEDKGIKKDINNSNKGDIEPLPELRDAAEQAAIDKKKEKKRKKKDKQKDNKNIEEEQAIGGAQIALDKLDIAKEEVKVLVDDEAAVDVDDENDEKNKKKDKKKKDKKAKDKIEKVEKKPKKTQVDAIKEMLRKRQEEEEENKKAFEEEEKRLNELEDKRIEKLKLEKERKEREKEKKKNKIAEQKAAGTFMTAEQKQKQKKAMEQLEAMRQSGVVIPALDNNVEQEKRRPKYIDKKKMKQKQMQKQDSLEKEKETTPVVTPRVEEKPIVKEVKQEIAAAWDDEVEESWEMVEEKDTVAPQEIKEEKEIEKKVESEEEEESSDESSSDSDSSSGEEEEESNKRETKEQIKERVLARIEKRKADAEAKKTTDDLRSPIICVMGHVDTGKTSLLDKIRRTHVQDGEAGGITQQIGATMVPADVVREQAKMVKDLKPEDVKIPGFLIIDTPGHASFTNLRSRGSSLCDLAILVVDLMHGLEDQTLESIKLLQNGNTPFVVAINKIDRLYEWKKQPNKDIRACLKAQQHNTNMQFKERYEFVKTQFAEQGINVALFWENPDPTEYISLIPTSAHSGDGMGNLMAYCTQFAQSQQAERLAYSEELFCSVLEVKALPGLGTTVDVILVNGKLRYGDVLVVAGTQGPIVTPVRELLMPQPLKEMRVKNPYERFKEVRGAQGIKILAKDMDHALAGLPLFVAHREDEVDVLRDIVSENYKKALKAFRMCDRGVHVQASTLGSLEALLVFLREEKIPYCGINIGPVHKKDVMKASTMLDHDSQWAVILAFDVKIEKDAQQMADEVGVKIFSADIIYHLEDAFRKHREDLKKKQREQNAHLAIFPCKLRVLPQFVFNSRNPIVMGVVIEGGILKPGTPICVPSQDSVMLGQVTSVEMNNKQVDAAKYGQEVCIKIEGMPGDAPKMYGRHFTHEDMLVSRIHRESIDVLKQYFREDLSKDDWKLIVELKKMLKIL